MFTVRNVGKTPQTRTQGTKIASDGLKGRIFECSLADLNQDEDQAFRKMFLKCEDEEREKEEKILFSSRRRARA